MKRRRNRDVLVEVVKDDLDILMHLFDTSSVGGNESDVCFQAIVQLMDRLLNLPSNPPRSTHVLWKCARYGKRGMNDRVILRLSSLTKR